jgi:gamma-glutamylcyclotransferase (GGCT)/AIG2-like uncharacterized protein YtfP
MSASSLFVYGSLIVPKVHEMILGRSVQSRAAVLRSYKRRIVSGKLYPGMVADSSEVVHGRVLFDLSDAELTLMVWHDAAWW